MLLLRFESELPTDVVAGAAVGCGVAGVAVGFVVALGTGECAAVDWADKTAGCFVAAGFEGWAVPMAASTTTTAAPPNKYFRLGDISDLRDS